ncbi:hypothetical protein [Paenibacillus methanolicus]|uniref:Uncharacterized protein n=1 Tax=Paenibacillus methanolicus TaxID=582686 RepID=A0A5S5BRX4_9BACL|nr:hypothetical protein [Paenibacillus methanolicus]TYP68900.1 hypothetical protein BCM02_11718 [Paenibacillus methanolicus]
MTTSRETIEKVQLQLTMPAFQTYDRGTVMLLMNYAAELEHRNNELAARLDRMAEHAKIQDNLSRAAIERMSGNIAQLSGELREERDGRKIPVPREVAAAFEELGLNDGADATGEAALSIMTMPFSFLGGPAQVIKRHFGSNIYELMEFFVNGYTIEEPVEQTATDYIAEQLGKMPPDSKPLMIIALGGMGLAHKLPH